MAEPAPTPAAKTQLLAGLLERHAIPYAVGGGIALIESTGQARCRLDGTYVDLFFSNLPFHDSASERVRRVPFGGTEINILSAEDLVVCKAMFNRPKDWVDIEQLVLTSANRFDREYTLSWLVEMLGADAPAVRRILAMSAAPED